jgi:hypothetical protein
VQRREAKFGPLAYAVFGFSAILLLGLVYFDVSVLKNWVFVPLFIVNLVWLIGAAIPVLLWLGRQTLNVYEVLLGFALLALLVGIGCLAVEVARYQGDIKAKSVSMAGLGPFHFPAHSGLG